MCVCVLNVQSINESRIFIIRFCFPLRWWLFLRKVCSTQSLSSSSLFASLVSATNNKQKDAKIKRLIVECRLLFRQLHIICPVERVEQISHVCVSGAQRLVVHCLDRGAYAFQTVLHRRHNTTKSNCTSFHSPKQFHDFVRHVLLNFNCQRKQKVFMSMVRLLPFYTFYCMPVFNPFRIIKLIIILIKYFSDLKMENEKKWMNECDYIKK